MVNHLSSCPRDVPRIRLVKNHGTNLLSYIIHKYIKFPSTSIYLFTALSAGCIIYVVVFEILQRERSKNIQPKIVQFLALVVGFCTMMTIDILSESETQCTCHKRYVHKMIISLILRAVAIFWVTYPWSLLKCYMEHNVQGWEKDRALGCVNLASWLPPAAGGEFTQPRAHSFAHLCKMFNNYFSAAHDHGHGGHEEHGEHGVHEIIALVNQTLNNITEVETGGHDGHDH